MIVYGADFSGAQNPSKGIYYARGNLTEDILVIDKIVHSDDRLDLFYAIHSLKGPWALDFPFSIPIAVYDYMQINNWSQLLQKVSGYSRKEFMKLLDDMEKKSIISACERKCVKSSNCCREVDAAVNSFSPLKKTNPGMRSMTYSGIKLLAYLRHLGHAVYPFDVFKENMARLYEIYPSYTWQKLGLKRSIHMGEFIGRFNSNFGLKIKMQLESGQVDTLDASDAVVACATLAQAIHKFQIETKENWDNRFYWISDQEWKWRLLEGLIVKI